MADGERRAREVTAEAEGLRARVAALEAELARAHAAAARARRLSAVARRLSGAPDAAQVARALVEEALVHAGASGGYVSLLTPDGELALADSFGYPPALLDGLRSVPLDADFPPAQAVRTARPLFLGSAQAFDAAFPGLASVRATFGDPAWAAVPLLVEGRPLGALGLSFAEPRDFDEDERAYLQALAAQAGQALERARLAERERTLRAEAERTTRSLEAFFTHAPVALALQGRDGAPVLGNPVSARLAPPLAEGAQRVLGEGRTVELEQEVPTPEGLRVLHAVHFPVWDAEGHLVATGAVVTDLTDRRRAEEALRLMAARAEAASRAKDEFLATMSHELRTPLTAVLGWTQMLRGRKLPPERVGHALATVERNARAQAQLIEDLLDVSRIAAGKVRVELAPVALAPLVDAAVEAQRPAVEAKGLVLEADVARGLPQVRGDAVRLQQVLNNLLSNAVKFTPPGGRVGVRLAPGPRGQVLEVEDSGEGISPEFLPHVFERFRQADASFTRVHGGLGLGLSIVRELVERHGGTVEAHSEGAGRGARFRVWLPEPQAPAQALSAAAPVPAQRLGGVRVLVVDDQPDMVELLQTELGLEGAQVVGAFSAAEALQRLAAEPFDALVADVGLPGQDGLSLLRALRERSPEQGGRVPALALTAYSRESDRAAALAAGFGAWLPKPVEAARVVEAVAKLLAQRPEATASQAG